MQALPDRAARIAELAQQFAEEALRVAIVAEILAGRASAPVESQP